MNKTANPNEMMNRYRYIEAHNRYKSIILIVAALLWLLSLEWLNDTCAPLVLPYLIVTFIVFTIKIYHHGN